jgi:CHASE3 domain sensor protein
MIDAADISLRHTRIDMNHTRQKPLALFACLLLALTGALAASLQSIQRLGPARHFMTSARRMQSPII